MVTSTCGAAYDHKLKETHTKAAWDAVWPAVDYSVAGRSDHCRRI